MTQPDQGHLDLDLLAELDEGLLAPADAATHDAHLTSCTHCRQDLARIRAVRAVLGSLPEEPMPADVADRLDAALIGAAGTATVVPIDRPRRGWRAHPTAAGLSAAAAGVALLAAIVLGTTLHSKKSLDATDSAGGPQSRIAPNSSQGYPLEVSGRHYNPSNANALVAAAAADALTTHVVGAVQQPGSSTEGAATPKASTEPKPPAALETLYTDPLALQRCVDALSGVPGTIPLAVDFGRYTDRAAGHINVPAMAVLLRSTSGGKIDGWIVGPACATAPDNNIYRVERVAAPAG